MSSFNEDSNSPKKELSKMTVKQKLMADLELVLPKGHRSAVGRLNKRHHSVHPADGNYGISFEQFLKLKRNDSHISQYSSNLERISRIQANAISNNQYDIKNYLNEKSPLNPQSSRLDRLRTKMLQEIGDSSGPIEEEDSNLAESAMQETF